MWEQIVDGFGTFLHSLAEISAGGLDLVGVVIIIFGSVHALVRLVQSLIRHSTFHVMTDLGKALALALEFKMGAEIIKTVIIHDLEELAILGVVIVIRALLSVIIHWEMRTEAKEKEAKDT